MKNYYNAKTNTCSKEQEYRKNKKKDYCSHCEMAINFFDEYTICQKGRDEKF